MLFDESLLVGLTDPETYAAGTGYFLDGRVTGVSAKRLPNAKVKVEGVVLGSREHRPSLTLSKELDAVDFFDCDCPFAAREACKHAIALGLAALPLEVGAAEATKDQMKDVLKSLAKRRKVEVSEEEAERLSKRLTELGVQLGDVTPADRRQGPRAKRTERHSLDAVVVKLDYEEGSDLATIDVFARYGSRDMPLLVGGGLTQEWLEDDVRHIADRDLDAEKDTYQFLLRWLPVGSRRDFHRYEIHGDEIYWFVKEVMPELEFRAEIEVSEAFRRLADISAAEVASTWETRTGTNLGWFDFSVEWQCAQTKLSTEALEEMVRSGKSFVRTKDGRFVEMKNVAEAEELLAFLEKAKKNADGTLSARLFEAPEMVALLERHGWNRLQATDRAFQKFLQEEKTGSPIEPVALSPALESILRPYQRQGVAWMSFLRNYQFAGILADDMGLGKTLQVLALFSHLKKQRTKPHLVVCPKTLILTWLEEAAKFTPELSVMSIEGLAEDRERKLAEAKQADIVVTSYSLLQRDVATYVKHGLAFSYVVLDEAQYVKNAGTLTAKAVKLLDSEHRLAITGTPLENGVRELWSIFDFLMPGFLSDATTFRRKFEKPIAEKGDKEALERLRRRIRPFLLRRTKQSELKDLPPKIEQERHCQLTPEQLVVYTRLLEEVRKDVFQAVEDKGFAKSRVEILAALTRLRRACDHPALVDPRLARTEELSGKMTHALELVREAVAGGHKVLLFSQYTTMLDLLREAIESSGIGHATIEGKTRDRGEQIKKFNEDPKTSVFLLSLKAGGTGLTLTAADTVILYDPWWNPQVERQAMDRAHRIGQTKTVNVYKLVTKGTVEEKVVELQQRKQQIFDALMEENAEALAALTWDEVKSLLE
jgi:superfamily II DNA or RNA helicase